MRELNEYIPVFLHKCTLSLPYLSTGVEDRCTRLIVFVIECAVAKEADVYLILLTSAWSGHLNYRHGFSS